ncbi:MAG: SMP-30/gluconolactonase/LRE family protein [Gammaproteobacteria bacterium]
MKSAVRIASLFVLGGCVLAWTAGAYAEGATKAWETPAEFKQPESVVYDAKRKILYVSNINGEAGGVDGNGFISQLGADGKITKLEWVTGLNAPKGMAIHGDKLYVSDITALVEIDIEKGQVSKRYEAPESKFLNDVTADSTGAVYVSDMMTNVIYRLSGDKFESWLKDDKLDNPNGLLAEKDRLVVGAWGKMTDGFKTAVPGHLKTVSLKDKTLGDLGDGKSVGNIDGVESDGKGGYIATDWMAGKLLHIDAKGAATTLAEVGQGSADHTVIPDQNLVLVPRMMNNTVIAYKVAQ